MKNILINAYRFNLQYAFELVDDIDDNLMTISPGKGLENHAAFTLGHLISAAALTSKYLGGPYEFDPEWEALFRRKGPGDPRMPESNKNAYPSKTQLLNELSRQHQLVEKLIVDLDEKRLAESAQWRFSKHMPLLGDLLYFMCITHESMHLGQLAGWRRALGLPSALAKL